MPKRSHAGFTLIELVIVMLIVGILTSIALPAYTQYVTKSRRAAGEACLAIYASYMERFYSTNMAYNQDSSGAALTTLPSQDCASTANTGQYYQYSIGSSTSSTYQLLATPKAGSSQAKNDKKCATLKLDQSGQRDKTGTGSVTDCWAH